MRVDVYEQGSWKLDRRIVGALHEVAAPSYHDCSAVLAREIAHCDTLLVLCDDGGSPACFSMLAWEPLALRRRTVDSVYLGLTVTRVDRKGQGLGRSIFRRISAHLASVEQSSGRALTVWFTTASTPAFLATSASFSEFVPDREGAFPAGSAAIAREIRALKFPTAPPNEIPFVLMGVATATRHSAPEHQRVRQLTESHRFELFERFGIDEQRGDRLLVLCRPGVPGASV